MLAQNFKTPTELDITDAELDAHVKVLGMLERGELRYYDYEGRAVGDCFNMESTGYRYSCGTVACIGGWVALTMGLDTVEAALYVGRADGNQSLLYYPESNMHLVTVDQAAQALRNWLTTGEPMWDEVRTER